MAKAQTMKPKSSVGDWLKGLMGGKTAKVPARAPSATSTVTNMPAAGGPAMRPGQGAKAAAAAAAKKAAGAKAAGWDFAQFRVPFIGEKPVVTQMQILGTAAVVLIVATAAAVYEDTQARTRNATFISIASQLQYHTQRLAKAAGLAARGQAAAFPQLADSRDQFAEYLAVLREGGSALGVDVPSAATNDELAGRLDDLAKRWPSSSNAASAI